MAWGLAAAESLVYATYYGQHTGKVGKPLD